MLMVLIIITIIKMTTYDFDNKTLKKDDINFVIYHSPCSDGFTSALCAYIYLRNKGKNMEDIKFFPGNYGNPDIPDVTGKNVLICDFSYKKEIFDKMYEQTNGNILVLDHHKTAEKELENVNNENKVFDMKHCGAYITWTYFFGFDNIPKMIEYVEDNDLWKKLLPNTREFTSFMFSVPFEFSEYEKFLDNNYIDNVAIPCGTGMQKQNDEYIRQLTKKTVPKFMEINGKYYFVTCLNSDILKSELGNKLVDGLVYCNFSSIYSNDHFRNSTTFSLRSLNDRTDVSEIAKLFGGGGHRNASGMAQKYIVNEIPGRVIDQYRLYYLLESVYETKVNNNFNVEFNIVSLNSSVCKKHLSKYLMQTRNILLNNENVEILEALTIMRINKKNNTYNMKYDGSNIWHYNGTQVEVVGTYSKNFMDWFNSLEKTNLFNDIKNDCIFNEKTNILTLKFKTINDMENFFIKN